MRTAQTDIRFPESDNTNCVDTANVCLSSSPVPIITSINVC